MSRSRHQALIEAPPEVVWELVGDPARYPDWWPRIVDVRGDRFEEGVEFVQVTRTPLGRSAETNILIDRMEELRQVRMHCRKSGTFAHWRLAPAQGDTFVDVTFGMEPTGRFERAFDWTVGRAYFRRWVAVSLESLDRQVRRDRDGSVSHNSG